MHRFKRFYFIRNVLSDLGFLDRIERIDRIGNTYAANSTVSVVPTRFGKKLTNRRTTTRFK